MNTQLYSTDQPEGQWVIIQKLIPPAKSGGQPRSLDTRQVINGILYVALVASNGKCCRETIRSGKACTAFSGLETTWHLETHP